MIKIGNIYNTPKKVFDTETYLNIVVQYQGNIVEEVSKNPDYYVTVINDKYAILSFKSDKSSNFDESSNLEKIKFDSVVYIKEPEFIHYKVYLLLMLLKYVRFKFLRL